MPLACHIFGKAEVAVNPGMVFNSLMMIFPASVTKKSTRANPEQPKA